MFQKFTEMSHNVKHIFTCLRSEYLRLKYFENNCQSYIKPETFTIGEHTTLQKINTPHQPNLVFKKAEGQIIPLRKSFKSFLELPGVVDIVTYMNAEMSAGSDVLSSFIQGNLWKTTREKFSKDVIVLPLLFYFYDFECCNPLGTKAGVYKIGAAYVSLACIPTDYISLLENIFLPQLFCSSDRSFYGNKKSFGALIKEFAYLEKEGITICIDSKEVRIYLTFVLVLGDNLGLNSIIGFQKSFSAKFFCRICKSSIDISKIQNTEDISTLRTKETYEIDAAALSYGIKEVCVFHHLPNFHVSQNMSLDTWHIF
jgi:hypothetical protein